MIPSKDDILSALKLKQGGSLVEKLQQTTVAICGLGGLGSNIAISLARAGIKKLILIDFDCIDVTNLHRQQYKASQVGEKKSVALPLNLKEIAPYVEIESHDVRIDNNNVFDLLKSADIICEAFDNAESKAILVNAVLEKLPNKYLVAASGMASLNTANLIRTRRLGSHFYLCGDGVNDVADGTGLVAPRVMACAAHQALTVIRIIGGIFEP